MNVPSIKFSLVHNWLYCLPLQPFTVIKLLYFAPQNAKLVHRVGLVMFVKLDLLNEHQPRATRGPVCKNQRLRNIWNNN